MLVVPAAIPFTTPAVVTPAFAVLLLAHVPPASALVSVMVAASHTDAGPEIGEGSAFTIMFFTAAHPVVSV